MADTDVLEQLFPWSGLLKLAAIFYSGVTSLKTQLSLINGAVVTSIVLQANDKIEWDVEDSLVGLRGTDESNLSVGLKLLEYIANHTGGGTSVVIQAMQREKLKDEPSRRNPARLCSSLDTVKWNIKELQVHLDRIDMDFIQGLPPSSYLESFFLENVGSFLLKPFSQANDEATSQFNNLKCKWVVDMSDLYSYEVRESFEKYGVKLYFLIKGNKTVLGVIQFMDKGTNTEVTVNCLDETTDQDVLHRAKCIARASLSLRIIVQLHAVRTHVCTAQRMVFESRDVENLSEHWQRFMTLFTLNTIEKNNKVLILTAKKCLFHRVFGLTEKGHDALIRDALAKGRYTRDELLGTPGTKWNTLFKPYMKACDTFVKEYFPNGAGLPAQFTHEDVATFVVTATAFHGMVGDNQLIDTSVSGFLIPSVYRENVIENPDSITMSSLRILHTLLIAVSTRLPRLDNDQIGPYFGVLSADKEKVWNNFTKGLLKLNDKLQTAWFHPYDFEVAVGY